MLPRSMATTYGICLHMIKIWNDTKVFTYFTKVSTLISGRVQNRRDVNVLLNEALLFAGVLFNYNRYICMNWFSVCTILKSSNLFVNLLRRRFWFSGNRIVLTSVSCEIFSCFQQIDYKLIWWILRLSGYFENS